MGKIFLLSAEVKGQRWLGWFWWFTSPVMVSVLGLGGCGFNPQPGFFQQCCWVYAIKVIELLITSLQCNQTI